MPEMPSGLMEPKLGVGGGSGGQRSRSFAFDQKVPKMAATNFTPTARGTGQGAGCPPSGRKVQKMGNIN